MGSELKTWADEKHPRDDRGRFDSDGGEGKAARESEKSGSAREASAKEFRSAFQSAFAGSEFASHVTHRSEDELREMRCFLSEDGKSGVAVHDHGDGRIEATALFNVGGVKGGGLKMLAHVIDHAGVNYVECYGPHLNAMYAKLGFEESERFPFDSSMAAKGWDYTKFDHPDYITMRLGKSAA